MMKMAKGWFMQNSIDICAAEVNGGRVLTRVPTYMIYNKMYNALEGNTDWHYPDSIVGTYLPKGVKRIRTCTFSIAGQLQYVSALKEST